MIMKKVFFSLLMTLFLNACGGGGGDGGNSSPGTGPNNGGATPAAAALTFTPTTITQTLTGGVSSKISLAATVNKPSDFNGATTVYAYFIDDVGVLLPNTQISQNSTTQYSVALYTSPTLSAGSHQGNLTVKLCRDSNCTSQFPGSPMLLPYSFQVNPPANLPTFGANPSVALTTDMYVGAAAPDPVTITIAGQGRTWTAKTDATWLKLSSTAGAGNAILTLSYAPASLQVGVYTSTIQVTSSDGQSVGLPVTLTIKPPAYKLLAAETGVALTATPAWSRLTRTLQINDSSGHGASWGASSDQTWLSATKSGNNLTLTANPASLAPDVISYATVTLSSADPSVTAPEPIKVALWKGSTTPTLATQIKQVYTNVIADPIRPLIYTHNSGSSIDVYNVYTSQKTATFTTLGTTLGNMTISPNGDKLYALDLATSRLVAIDLVTPSKISKWDLSAALTTDVRMKAIRSNGVEIIITNFGTAYLASNGKFISNTGIVGRIDLAVTADGKKVYAQDEGFSPSRTWAYSVDYSELNGGYVAVSLLTQPTGVIGIANGVAMSNGADIAVSADGSRVYTANGAPYRCGSLSPVNLGFISALPGGDTFPNNVKVASDGRVFCGISGGYSSSDVWMHGADGTLIRSFKFAGSARNLIDRQMAVSGDGLMLVGITNDPLLAIVPVGP
ncbi:putative lipoprotein [Collimonas pratensis]|uniref:Lipoprotein n=2 Tax=Collimonas pratensis TaxID=279113 RepID=A0ABN4MBH5_9BURK|nr:putative lipoprotein [Collimonas pratensis]